MVATGFRQMVAALQPKTRNLERRILDLAAEAAVMSMSPPVLEVQASSFYGWQPPRTLGPRRVRPASRPRGETLF